MVFMLKLQPEKEAQIIVFSLLVITCSLLCGRQYDDN